MFNRVWNHYFSPSILGVFPLFLETPIILGKVSIVSKGLPVIGPSHFWGIWQTIPSLSSTWQHDQYNIIWPNWNNNPPSPGFPWNLRGRMGPLVLTTIWGVVFRSVRFRSRANLTRYIPKDHCSEVIQNIVFQVHPLSGAKSSWSLTVRPRKPWWLEDKPASCWGLVSFQGLCWTSQGYIFCILPKRGFTVR